MARLFTSHDKYHVHKVLGFLVLLSYLYRLFCLLRFGTAFPDFETVWFASSSVAIHGLLSWSSLLLPLPATRNFSSPMIWPEFRLHSITFATRHVLVTILTLHGLWPNQNVWTHALARAVILLGTIQVASMITDKWGDREQRTTNSMVYPSTISPQQQAQIKAAYSRAQFSATLACLLPDATQTFAPLLAIQMSPLLMTLVRKGKINSLTYHRVYATSLMIGYLMVLVRTLDDSKLAAISRVIMFLPTPYLRKHMTAMKLGIVQVLFAIVFCPLVVFPFLERFGLPIGDEHGIASSYDLVIHRLVWVAIIVTTARQLELYSPLFKTTAKEESEDRQLSTFPSKPSSASTLDAVGIYLPVAAVLYTMAPQMMTTMGGLVEVSRAF
ncbi:expressed unknown protein [Seminavis robusta]|uniref:Uncharacterized protein n=1 Tax=Seminavis robusta TaxID=568900 RepID=A0A9N8EVU5_9STRA|nr:expressed unknown protein [Seminavis robusta]|eukprot:Sro2035_g312040.1 n/a (384) ;mRNA; f:3130-4281